MIKIVVLGTAGSAPTKMRHLSCIALTYNGETLLFDCGEGTQFQMLKYGINAVRVKAIFLSHAHGDHIIGIAGLVRTMALNSRREPLLIFVPEGYEKVVKSLIVFDRALISYPITIKGIRSGVVYSGKNYTVSSFRLNHTIPTYGYVFKENDRRRFLKDVAERRGVRGRMFATLQKRGSIRVGNRTIRMSELSRKQIGKKVVYAVDTRPTNATILAARHADLLIHEAAYIGAERKLARERKHATAIEAADLARKAGVKQLVLTHISARHKDSTVLSKEAKRVFRNAVVAEDGYSLII